jgi:hypothetical protein
MRLLESRERFRNPSQVRRRSVGARLPSEKQLFDLIAGHMHVYGGTFRERGAPARTGRAYLLLLLVSLLAWALIGYAIFRLVSAAA